MHASQPTTPSSSPLSALVLAWVLLGAFAAGGVWLGAYMRLAPSTPVPIQAQVGGKHTSFGAGRRQVLQESEPRWSQLSTTQKEALYPLANSWSLMSEAQKRNWLHLALDFHALPAQEQIKMLARMTDWASLSIQQRSQARLNYAAAAALPAESRRAKWEAYQALSAEEKKRLAAKAAPRPRGAATAIRPSQKKLVRIPAANNVPTATPNPPKIKIEPLQPPPPPVQAKPPAPTPPPETVETAPVAPRSAEPIALPPLAAPNPTPAPSPASPPVSASDIDAVRQQPQ